MEWENAEGTGTGALETKGKVSRSDTDNGISNRVSHKYASGWAVGRPGWGPG